jgi:hypothetical protein
MFCGYEVNCDAWGLGSSNVAGGSGGRADACGWLRPVGSHPLELPVSMSQLPIANEDADDFVWVLQVP